MHLCFPLILVNQAGETALDIAKRLRATQCEDLVSRNGRGVASTHGLPSHVTLRTWSGRYKQQIHLLEHWLKKLR